MRYFQVHFRQLRITFFHNYGGRKKITFCQMHNTILPRVKQFLNVKMMNLEKIK